MVFSMKWTEISPFIRRTIQCPHRHAERNAQRSLNFLRTTHRSSVRNSLILATASPKSRIAACTTVTERHIKHAAEAPQPPIKDPSHPSLFYHLFLAPETGREPVFALSFSEARPRGVRSGTVLGWLPAQAEGGQDESGLNDFIENAHFLPLLHEAVKSGLQEDEIWVNGAIQTQSGWMHIFDHRNVPPLGRISDPDDILASVRVEDGQMLIDTYQPMPSYRLCTGDGILQLTDGLMSRLNEILDRKD